jgi:ribose transport system substrate-binding protein
MVTRFRRLIVGLVVIPGMLVLAACAGSTPSSSSSSSSASSGGASSAGGSAGAGAADPKDLKVGWSTIYLTPSWMQETQKLLTARVETLKSSGVIGTYKEFNANGDTSQQVAQIQSMISQKYNVILVDAGSSTALNSVLESAVDAGITVVNFDSLVSTDKVIRVGTDQKKWGAMMAQFIVDKLKGKGSIIAFNGPAGVAVSEDRWAGAKAVFDKNPDIKIVTTLNSEYNIAPAAQAFASAYAAHPDIDAVFSQGGALSAAALQTLIKQKAKLIPITGENYNGFLKMWSTNVSKGFSSLATAQPNYLAVIALDAAVAKVKGQKIASDITIPLPSITDANLAQYVKTDLPDDYYPIQDISEAEINKILGLS